MALTRGWINLVCLGNQRIISLVQTVLDLASHALTCRRASSRRFWPSMNALLRANCCAATITATMHPATYCALLPASCGLDGRADGLQCVTVMAILSKVFHQSPSFRFASHVDPFEISWSLTILARSLRQTKRSRKQSWQLSCHRARLNDILELTYKA